MLALNINNSIIEDFFNKECNRDYDKFISNIVNYIENYRIKQSVKRGLEEVKLQNNGKLEKRELFEKWLKKKVKHESTAKNYIKEALEKNLPNKLKDLNEKDENFFSILEIDNINELENLYKRLLKGGDLYEFNKSSNHEQPSAAIRKYIEFLKEK